MPKRAKSDGSLTGGSGDVNPQWFGMQISQVANDATTTQAYPLPVQRLNDKDQSQVMEILRIVWDLPAFLPGSNSTLSLAGFLTTKDPNLTSGGLPLSQFNKLRVQGGTIDYFNRTVATSASFVGDIMYDEPTFHELTDGAGHGVLVATDTLFLTLASEIGASGATGTQSNMMCKVLYRWKNVTVTEYVGIVQSQT